MRLIIEKGTNPRTRLVPDNLERDSWQLLHPLCELGRSVNQVHHLASPPFSFRSVVPDARQVTQKVGSAQLLGLARSASLTP